MRRPNLGILPIDIAVSLVHNPNTGTTQGVLLGCSNDQVLYIRKQLTQLASLANHPALIPTLVSSYFCSLLETSISELWDELVTIEDKSGQTGIQVYDSSGPWPESEDKDYTVITKEALGVVQIAMARQSSVDTLIQSIDSIQECLKYIDSATPLENKDAVHTMSSIIEERLRFVTENAKELLSRTQFIKERTQAQIAAVRLILSYT